MARVLVTGQDQAAASPGEKLAVGLKGILSTLMGVASSPMSPISRTASFAKDIPKIVTDPQFAAQEYGLAAPQKLSDIPKSFGKFVGKTSSIGTELGFLGAGGAPEASTLEGAKFLTKAGEYAKAFAPAGFAYGATEPGLKNIKDRIINGLGTAVVSTVAAPVIDKILTSVGLSAAKSVISPKVSRADPFKVPYDLEAATAEALKSSKPTDISLGAIQKSLGKVVEDLGNQIESKVAAVKKVFSNSELFGTTFMDNISKKLPTVSEAQIGDKVQPWLDIVLKFGQPTADKADFNYSLTSLNRARMAVGAFLKDEKAWEQAGNGTLTDEAKKVGMQVYFQLRDIVNSEVRKAGEGSVAALMDREARLYMAANGIARRISGASRPNAMLLRSLQGLGIRSLFDPGLLIFSRAATSPIGQQAVLMKLLQSMGLEQGNQPAQ